MAIKYYNTLTRKKESFESLEPGKVRLYTCGPTVYDRAHIGNFRTFMFEDLLKRHLMLKGYEVIHVMNITDVDDKTIARAEKEQTALSDLTQHYNNLFMDDVQRLRIIPADIYPRATRHIDDMIAMIRMLVDKGFAYQTEDGSVYFKIDAYKNYGKLTHLKREQQQTSQRVAADEYTKDNPQDFALWKRWKDEDGVVGWESPWGKGRPGWHMECSTMSMKYLGNLFDIHCGGVDNIFPHHENEIAQSVCATGDAFVRVWMHAEHLQVDGGKMSKSLGNFYTITELIDHGMPAEAIRYILLSSHYRTKLNFSLKKKQEALSAIQRVADLALRLEQEVGQVEPNDDLPSEFEDFVAALDDDLDTPKALAVFFEWVREINSRLDRGAVDKSVGQAGINFIRKFDSVFDIMPEKQAVPDDVDTLVAKRESARREKNWTQADELRNAIRDKGWTVEDTPDGPVVKPSG